MTDRTALAEAIAKALAKNRWWLSSSDLRPEITRLLAEYEMTRTKRIGHDVSCSKCDLPIRDGLCACPAGDCGEGVAIVFDIPCHQTNETAEARCAQLEAEHEQLRNGLKDLSRYESEEIEGSSGYFVDWDDIAELLKGTK